MQCFDFTRGPRTNIQAPGHWPPTPGFASRTTPGRIAALVAVAMLVVTLALSSLVPIPDALAQTNVGIAFSITPSLFTIVVQ